MNFWCILRSDTIFSNKLSVSAWLCLDHDDALLPVLLCVCLSAAVSVLAFSADTVKVTVCHVYPDPLKMTVQIKSNGLTAQSIDVKYKQCVSTTTSDFAVASGALISLDVHSSDGTISQNSGRAMEE
jgi:hypothetical protein